MDHGPKPFAGLPAGVKDPEVQAALYILFLWNGKTYSNFPEDKEAGYGKTASFSIVLIPMDRP